MEATVKKYDLLPYSKLVWKTLQRDPKAEWYCVIVRWDAQKIDGGRLIKAIEKALNNHPVFSTEIDENGWQYLVKKGNILHGKYHSVDLACNQEGEYLQIRLNRIMGDGFSIKILMEDIYLSYKGECLEQDNYWQYLDALETHKTTLKYANHRELLVREFGAIEYPVALAENEVDEKEVGGTKKLDLECKAEDLEQFCKEWTCPLTGIMCLAVGLAIMNLNGTDEAGLTWAYRGREREMEQRIFGSLHKDVPLKLERENLPDMIRHVRTKIRKGIATSDYPFTLLEPESSPWHRAANVIIEEDWIGGAVFPEGLELEEEATKSALAYLDIEIRHHPLNLTIRYNTTWFAKPQIDLFGNEIKRNLAQLLSTHRE